MSDVKALGEQIVKSVTALIERTFAKANARIDELRDQVIFWHAAQQRDGEEVMALSHALAGLPPAERGEKGDPGRDGAPGEKGDPGADGKDGTPGAPGKPGEKGDPGELGPPGSPGKDGGDGSPGREGSKGDPGEKGDPGRDGSPGLKGDSGRDGADGRDALEIVIQPSIEPTKSYQRGIFATHRGGLWRSMRKTDPLTNRGAEEAGWVVFVDGVESVKFTQTGDRNFDLVTRRSSGVVEKIEVRFDVPLYRQIFKAGDRYEKSDMVTYAGSVWMALRDEPAGPPDMAPADWRLVVKRGRDGKDGKDGARGEKGAKGETGRDLTMLGPDGSKLR